MKVLQTKFWVVSGVRPAIVIILTKLDSIGSCLHLGFFMHHNLIFLELVEDTSLYISTYIWLTMGSFKPYQCGWGTSCPKPWASWHLATLRIQPFQDQK